MQQVSLLGSDQFSDLLKQLANAPQQGNRAPLVYGYLPTQFAGEGQAFRLDIAPNFFIDADTEDTLHIEARLADGSALPAWLTWDAKRLVLEGMPLQQDAGKLQLALIATDLRGASSQVSFTLVTTMLNRAPVLNQAPAMIGWKIGAQNEFQIPANLFTDPNEGDVLRYQLTLADGSQLPAWMQFDPLTNMLSGIPSFDSLLKPIRLKITAFDLGGLSAITVLPLAAANIGTDADDVLSGSIADEYLQGFGGNDILDSGGGDDALSGGSGDDMLIGGDGSDTYLFDAEWGWDDIQETASPSDNNVIRFGEGIFPSDIYLSRNLNALHVRNRETYDLIRVSTTAEDGMPIYQQGLVSEILFESGEVWNALSDHDIAFEGMLDTSNTNFAGSLRDDLIWTSWIGTTVRAGHGNDALFGNSGDDQLFGETGDDILDGGSGNDLLAGGFGDDIYRVSTWSGNKTVIDTGGIDTLELGGVNSTIDLNLQRSGGDLLAGFTNARGNVTIKNFFNADGEVNASGAIEWFQFEDGRHISALSLASAIGVAKATPTSGSFTNIAFNPQ
jgi:hypothetical protein